MSDLSSALPMPDLSPVDILAEEIGAVAGRIEREADLRLTAAVAELRHQEAERKASMARMEQSLTERLAGLRDGQNGKDGADGRPGADGPPGSPGPPGEASPPADIPPAPDEVAAMIERALTILAEPAIVQKAEAPLVINITGPDAGARRKTITMRRDADGNAIADVVEQGTG